MLLLYPASRSKRPVSFSIFTFHYASTLSPLRLWSMSPRIIYIPLCFYFIFLIHLLTVRFPFIYIPLCFYFIATAILQSVRQHDLHSTMLLLYPGKSRRGHACGYIYIPLCFYFISFGREITALTEVNLHSTMLLLYRAWDIYLTAGSLIYIPLCFYFIKRYRRKRSLDAKFTFHYASTLSWVTTPPLGR